MSKKYFHLIRLIEFARPRPVFLSFFLFFPSAWAGRRLTNKQLSAKKNRKKGRARFLGYLARFPDLITANQHLQGHPIPLNYIMTII